RFAQAAVIPADGEDRFPAEGVAARAIRWSGARLRRASDRPWAAIVPLLRCPDCRAPLHRLGHTAYRCSGCGADFPVDKMGRPWLLPGSRQGATWERTGSIA